MNKLTPDGQSVIDANGKAWALETAYPMPLPDGIYDNSTINFFYWSRLFKKWCAWPHGSLHWMLRTEPPPPKTQEELDEEAFEAWVERDAFTMNCGMERAYSQNAWRAALAYERGKAKP